MPIFLLIKQIVRELELPPLNMNTKQISLLSATLTFPHEMSLQVRDRKLTILVIYAEASSCITTALSKPVCSLRKEIPFKSTSGEFPFLSPIL